jgi:hypothetical protein
VRPVRGRSDLTGDIVAYPVETPTIVNTIPFRGDHRPAAQTTAYHPDYQDAFLQNGFAAHYIREPHQTPGIGQQQPPRGGMAPNPFTAPPLLATEPVYGAEEQERNFRALLNQGFGTAPAAQTYASVGAPKFRLWRSTCAHPRITTASRKPIAQGAGRLNPIFRSPATVTPVVTCLCSDTERATANQFGSVAIDLLYGGVGGTRRLVLQEESKRSNTCPKTQWSGKLPERPES